MATVTLYEDNAGGLFLHADGGAMVYETRPGLDTPEHEMAYVADNPDGDPGGWSDDWQHARDEVDLDRYDEVAVWDGGVITVIGVHGGAASDYLDIPESFQDFGLTPAAMRAEWERRAAAWVW